MGIFPSIPYGKDQKRAMTSPLKRSRRRRLTVVSAMHYVRLIYRSVLFLLLALQYIRFRLDRQVSLTALMEQRPLQIGRAHV